MTIIETTTEANLEGLRIFISYPRGGLAHTWAEKVQRHMENLGAEVWRDEHSIGKNDPDFDIEIEGAVKKTDVLIFILGQDTYNSKWQRMEVRWANKFRKSVVVLRIVANVSPPFIYFEEEQLVEVRSDHQETLRILTNALVTAWRESRTRSPDEEQPTARVGISPGPVSLQRQHEITYLGKLIHKTYSKLEMLYVPLEAKKHRSHSPSRAETLTEWIDINATLRMLEINTTANEQVVEKTYADALDAYRDLEGKSVRRLAVLGEPGAGKSFSLQRIAVEYAQRALQDPQAPVPVLVPLGPWTYEAQSLKDFIENSFNDDDGGKIGRYFTALYEQKRAVLLLDGMNEIPPGQRKSKARQILDLAEDERFASVIVSCREKDFTADFHLPFDTLVLQPLKPTQILASLKRKLSLQHDTDAGASEWAEDFFWQLAGGTGLRQVWQTWQQAGADLDLFWSADEVPRDNPDISSRTSASQDQLWREARFNLRSMLRLASNPFLLKIITYYAIAGSPIPSNRAQLFQGFFQVLYAHERVKRDAQHDTTIPAQTDWEAALVELAAVMQHKAGAQQADGVQTSLPRAQCPGCLTPDILDFSVDASVLQIKGDDIRFSHQLLQEYLASRLLLEASRVQANHSGSRAAQDFWPAASWWERTGWEVVAEIAAESCGNDDAAQARLMAWLADANPEVACEVWQRLGKPVLPQALLTAISNRWLARMTNVKQEPHPHARAVIGRALGRFGLDRREGVGLRPDGLPDIDWVEIPAHPFIYQEAEHLALPAFRIARYPVTNAQFQSFIDAGGYRENDWWQGLARRFDTPASPAWDEPNAPRENVSWYEAVAFCRWLSAQPGFAVTLPTEQQWERAARGTQGFEYPWGNVYRAGDANCNETYDKGTYHVGRTTAVGLYPQAASPEEVLKPKVLDMAGNVWEWCLNEFGTPENCQLPGDEARVLRGGSWYDDPGRVRAAARGDLTPGSRNFNIGFRVLCSSPIE